MQVGQIYSSLYHGKKGRTIFEMAVRKMKAKAVRVVCNNCFQQTIGIRDETGVIKYRCSRCGALTVSKVMGRRHVQYDMYAPQGQELMDDDDDP